MTINLFSDSPVVYWTLPVVKHLRKTPESRAGFPKQTAEQSLLQVQSWGRLPMVCPISKVILPFLSRPTHTQTHTHVCTCAQSLQLGWVPTWAASQSCFSHATHGFSQRCMMGKTRQETKRQTNQLVSFPFRHTWWFELENSQLNTSAVTYILKACHPKKWEAPSAFCGLE